MSGIYIPGVEIPRTCMDCHYHKSLRDQCILTHRDQRDLWSRPDWCPIVPVPAHGRLIDADAALKKLERIALPDDLSYTIGHDIAKQFLKNAPTIIPASEEGE